jgi:transposase InsO family protein
VEQVLFDGVLTDPERLRNLLVAQALSRPFRHCRFAFGQAGHLTQTVTRGRSSRTSTGMSMFYINLSGTFYYLCSVLDGCSRFLVHWDLRESMKETDIEMILERAKEKYPGLSQIRKAPSADMPKIFKFFLQAIDLASQIVHG